jgi:hypothetical protein
MSSNDVKEELQQEKLNIINKIKAGMNISISNLSKSYDEFFKSVPEDFNDKKK